jgi:5-oxoprolinase (ATP-hydrolysing) subunit A
MPRLLLNADMGESFGPWVMGLDAEVMPHVDLANVACGFHAGDPHVMRRTVRLAVQHDVRVGAHPAYPDLMGFGRRSLACSPAEVEDLVLYQIGALAGICQAEGIRLHYVKPHGALYNDMARDPEIMAAVMRAILAYDPGLPLMTMATRDTSAACELAARLGVTLWFEAFADRAYDGEGRLVSRREPGAVHHDPEGIVDQAKRIALGQPLTASDGSQLVLSADTLCVHGDNPESIAAVKAIREALNMLEEA